MVETEKRSVWDEIDDILEDEGDDDPSLVRSLPKNPASTKPSLTASKSPAITVSNSPSSTSLVPQATSPPPARSWSQRHPLKRAEAKLSLPLDDDEEEELKKQIEIQEEQYLLQQQQQQQIQQQQQPMTRNGSFSPTSFPTYSPLPRVSSKDKYGSEQPSTPSGIQMQRIPSRIANQEKFKSSDLQNSYTQVLQLQMMQATQQKKMEQLQALQAHSQMQFITLLSNSSYTSIQSYAPSSTTPELPRINSKPGATNLKTVASSTNLKALSSSPSSGSSRALQTSPSSSSPMTASRPPMPRQAPPPVDIAPSDAAFLIQSPSCRTFPVDSAQSSPLDDTSTRSPKLSLLQASTKAVFGEDEDDDPTWQKLKQLGKEPAPVEIKSPPKQQPIQVEQEEQDVVRASSDSSLDAILKEINSTLSVK